MIMMQRLLSILCLTVSFFLIIFSPVTAKKKPKEKKPAGDQFQVSKHLSNVTLSHDLRKQVSASSVLDTFVLAEFSFNPGGVPSTEGWSGVDMTAALDTFCHVANEDELNGGTFVDLTEADWGLIEAYLLENEKLFGIKVKDLLTVDGIQSTPSNVYRKVVVKEQTAILTETANR